ncbi:NRDE family protein [Parasphingopyxis sp. CP4]|uniref:NRDE family protein n=1 Tax=Parasphingopyxis sp. CP4 TaxID=2724527 RepID=UPI0015A05C61|nr:NRDE family protein [Parasphingopyxis sp. CP4]QLC21369.1 NRDE family protein [Parasphingopyxis sp. CP4]
MCVLACAWQAHPDWQLVMIGNRDELHARSAAPLARWEPPSDVIAGRDLEAGGTWLGISDKGRFAVVTNVANPDGPQPGMASRGQLVADLIDGSGIFGQPSEAQLDAFNPFNVIAIGDGIANLLTNRPQPKISPLNPGLYGLSNSLAEENWPKTDRIKSQLQVWLEAGSGDHSALLDGLRADDEPQVEPRRARHSPIFIRNPIYGTRCSTVVAVDRHGEGQIIERRYDPDGNALGDTHIGFNWR